MLLNLTVTSKTSYLCLFCLFSGISLLTLQFQHKGVLISNSIIIKIDQNRKIDENLIFKITYNKNYKSNNSDILCRLCDLTLNHVLLSCCYLHLTCTDTKADKS